MKSILLILLFPISLFSTTIYSITIEDAKGNRRSLDFCRDKKILVVNIATGSPKEKQIGELQQLQNKFGDKLIILAFPSESFGQETRTDKGIEQYCINKYGTTFFVSRKSKVQGTGKHTIYEWLTCKTKNGVADYNVKGDYQKFIINEQGELIGYFSGDVSPLDKNLLITLNSTTN